MKKLKQSKSLLAKGYLFFNLLLPQTLLKYIMRELNYNLGSEYCVGKCLQRSLAPNFNGGRALEFSRSSGSNALWRP